MYRKQTICLNMIVKNEAHIIEETLNSIYNYIDYYVINDTGSTDGTREVIKSFFDSKNIQGEIFDHEFRSCSCHFGIYKKYDWFHFGWNRSYALDKCIGKSDYILIMDADDVIVGDLQLHSHLTDDCYDFKIGNEFIYYRPQLIKNDKRLAWKYIGGLHEYLDISNAQKKSVLEGNYYMDSRRLGDRSKTEQKYLKDAHIFEELLKNEPLNNRYLFYCAQSFYDANIYEKALEYYQKRIIKNNCTEEDYYSQYKIALCMEHLKFPFDDVIIAFLKCHKNFPYRAEPLFQILCLCKINKKYQLGYKYAKKALDIPFPKNNAMFVSKDIYDHLFMDEYAECAFMCGKYYESYNIWHNLLSKKHIPNIHQTRISHNMNQSNFFLTMDDSNIQKKPILCFYVGYIDDCNKNTNKIYGSEIALIRLAELFSVHYNVHIFGTCFDTNTINGIHYMNSNKLNDFCLSNEVSVMIISRYINFFIDFTFNAKKTFLWLHDTIAAPVWNGIEMPKKGKNLLENMMGNLNGIIVLSEWHKQNILNIYNIDHNKIIIIGNGIDIELFDENVQKVQNRFVYMSNPSRGLALLVDHFHTIKKYMPNAELFIYRGADEFDDKSLVNSIDGYDYIKFMGRLDNNQLISEILKAEYWYYPTNFYETYCTSALEAQMAGCICITSKIGALESTVGDRGILIDKSANTIEYLNESVNHILMLNNNSQLKNTYIAKSKEWAKQQTWTKRSKEWLSLFHK